MTAREFTMLTLIQHCYLSLFGNSYCLVRNWTGQTALRPVTTPESAES